MDVCFDVFYEYEGIDWLVSCCMVQYDIQMMCLDKFGYEVLIVVVGCKYYIYFDLVYGIMQGFLLEVDLGQLGEVVVVLK